MFAAPSHMITPATGMIQKLSALIRGNAMSFAPMSGGATRGPPLPMGRRVPYPGIRDKAFHRERSSGVRPEKSYRPTTNTLEESEFRQAMSGLRRIGLVASALVLSVGFLGGNARAQGISTGQQATDQLFYLVLVPAIGIGILVMGLVAYAVLKFRVRKGHTVR